MTCFRLIPALTRGILLVILLGIVTDVDALLPFIKPCKRVPDPAWTECILDSISLAYPHFIKGARQYRIPSMDPFHVDKLVIEQGTQFLGFAIENTDVTLRGLKSGFVSHARVNLDENTAEYSVTIPELILDGKYFLAGKILSLHVNGSGEENMRLKDVFAKVNANYNVHKGLSKTGVEHDYFNITDVSIDLDMREVTMEFGNLFNGNKVLENSANRFLSRNWREIFRYLGPAINKALSDEIYKYLKYAYEFMPLDEMYPYYYDPRKPAPGTLGNTYNRNTEEVKL